jgi:2-amino-4-hydroxy-6-hydroxymethyldihydropteridine diphosphokinase
MQVAERAPTVTAVAAYIALGANLGDAAATLGQAMDDIGRLPGTRMVRRSSLYRSAPVDSSGPDYINAVVEVMTSQTAPDLLQLLQNLEQAAGRERPWRNAPRTLDLDILLYGHLRLESPRLTLPHPRMRERAFVLVPLAEIAPHWQAAARAPAVAAQRIERLAAG